MNDAELLEKTREVDTPEGHQDIIKSQWQDFASLALRRVQSEGRGAVVIDLRLASRAGSGINLPTYYLAETSEKLAKRGGWPSEEIAQVIRDYDPAQEVVFIFISLDGDFVYYQVSDDYPFPLQGE
jgi:hypothetical protein